jgi:hypothetical protein
MLTSLRSAAAKPLPAGALSLTPSETPRMVKGRTQRKSSGACGLLGGAMEQQYQSSMQSQQPQRPRWWKRHRAAHSFRAIARDLAARNVPTKRGGKCGKRPGLAGCSRTIYS